MTRAVEYEVKAGYLVTIQIELDTETQAELAAGALRQGLRLESYAQRLLRNAVLSRSHQASRATQEEFRDFLDVLSSKSPEVPHLRDETFSRETIYGEHD